MGSSLLIDLAIVMVLAGAMTLLCHRLKQPVVIGYLIAGFIIGPYFPPFSFITNLSNIQTMAELGLVFLLFSLGLEFNLPKIQRIGFSALIPVCFGVSGMLLLGYGLGNLFHWNRMESIFLGAILCISSTTIIVKVFSDFKIQQERFAQIVFGILVLQDIVAITILSILSGLRHNSETNAHTIIQSFLGIGLFITIFLVLGLLLIPKLLNSVSKFKSKEIMGIISLALCLGGASTAHSFNYSVALGSFLTGAIIAATPQSNDIEDWIHPIRDMFSALFFVSAGMLIQPGILWEYKFPIIMITLIVILGQFLANTIGCFIAGYDAKTSVRVGMSLAQIGEFSFIIASLGVSLKMTSDFLYPIVVMVSSLTTLTTPYFIRNSDLILKGFSIATPHSFKTKLTQYHSWTQKISSQNQVQATAIFSKYLIRLGIYLAFFVTMTSILNVVSIFLIHKISIFSFILIWLLAGILFIPVIIALSKYASHITLLIVTKNKKLLANLNIHSFYNSVNSLIIIFFAGLLLLSASRFIEKIEFLIGVMVFFILFVKIFPKKINQWKENLEGILDQIIGLATSEPTRQAVLKAGDGKLLLINITDQITLTDGCTAINQTIRDLNLREKTKCSIVAIYREGQHISNPPPDTILLPNDLLIILGNKEELLEAKNFLNK
ncbi:MAG: cation:proton antiporter [Elusimicrobiota bacterium]